MKLFGRTACEEDRDWQVRVFFNDKGDESVRLTEQLNVEEAQKFFNDLKKELEESKSDWIEVNKDMGRKNKAFLINRKNITMVDVRSD